MIQAGGARGARPVAPFAMHRQSPQARGLQLWCPVGALEGHGIRDQVYGRVYLKSAGVMTTTLGPHGRGVTSDGNGGSLYDDTNFGGTTLGIASATGGSYAAWIRVPAATSGAVFKVGSSSDGVGFGIGAGTMDSDGLEIIALREAIAWHASGVSVTASKWHHVACTFSTAALRMYLDGVDIGGVAAAPNWPTVSSGQCTFLLGYSSRIGIIDTVDLRIWNRTLTASDVWDLYAPQTRWDLYQVPARRLAIEGGVSPITGTGDWIVPHATFDGSGTVLVPSITGTATFTAPHTTWSGGGASYYTYPTRRQRTFMLPASKDLAWVFLRNLELLVQAGVGNTVAPGNDPQITFAVSRDGGQTWGPERAVSAGKIGQYKRRARFRNLGRYRKGGVGRITVTDPVPWAFLRASADIEEGTR